jgi:succinate dehydrogenase / fumarate reductase flavoprotein subunit
VPEAEVEAAMAEALEPYGRDGGENPYAVHQELQQTMNDLVGIIRREEELEQAIEALGKLRERVESVSVEGGRGYHPGWHLALDLRNMVLVSECVAKAALERQESRGGHTRDDYPAMSPEWRKLNLVCRLGDGSNGFVELKHQDMDPMREDLIGLFEVDELKKYLTEGELPSEEN